jgi:hypothetical protein
MSTADEIQQLALDVFENKLDYTDDSFITIMNLLKESYMKVKGFLNETENEKDLDSVEDSGADLDSDEEYGVRHYANYNSDNESDGESYTGSYLSAY